jgi:DUF971 family protein
MTDPVPLEIKTAGGGAALAIAWSDGAETRIAAETLRRSSRSAQSLRAAIDGGAPAASAALRVVDVRAVGLYAINIRFSDGYDRGVYPWKVLRELALLEGAAHGTA